VAEPIQITGAWWISGRAEVHGPSGVFKVGTILARDRQDRIYRLDRTEFRDPAATLARINRARQINPALWSFKADDAEAAAYYANHFEPGEPH